MLPCSNQERVTQQVKPTVDLLTNMDELHPEVLLQHSIRPEDYKPGLVFRSAIESIRGKFIASSTTTREALVGDVLHRMVKQGAVRDYDRTGANARYDFAVALERNPDYFAALEVKGGEGNSINISERPLWAREFGVWCHLDGAIGNQPAHGAQSIVNRLTNDLVRRQKVVDMVLFKDILCGTPTRPCPKYGGRETSIGLSAAPDVFLLPSHVPSLEDPEPPVHSLESLRLPGLILGLFGVDGSSVADHIWQVRVSLIQLSDGRLQRIVEAFHHNEVVWESKSRAWRE